MSDTKMNRKLEWYVAGVLFFLLMARACAFGVEYWPQLDDYIQHHNYATGFTFFELCRMVGILGSRPLAGVADYFVWTPLFECMILGVAIISALYVASALILKRLMERYFQVGPVFLVVMVLLPLGVEGTYWMSASSRVVCGLFFACLAAAAFGRWLDTGAAPWALVFGVLILIPFGFYEQSAVFAMTLVLGMGILELSRHWKRSLLALWSIPAAAVYLGVTRLLSRQGLYANRMELMLPTSDYYWDTFLPDILSQIKTVLLQGNFYTLAKGFVRGMRMVLSGELLLWFVVVLLLCGLLGWSAMKLPQSGWKLHPALAVVVGVLLTVAPLTPFLVLANPWFSARGAVTSFPGIALLCDLCLTGICKLIPLRSRGVATLSAAAALVFCVAGASEIGDYRDTTMNDQSIAQLTVDTLSRDFPAVEETRMLRVGLLGVEASFLPNQNWFWHEHIHGCTESAWAFGGVLGYVAEDDIILPSVTPLPTDPIYKRWNAQTNRPGGFDALYYYDQGEKCLIPVRLEQTGEYDYNVYTEDGLEVGRIWEEADGIGYFRNSIKKD